MKNEKNNGCPSNFYIYMYCYNNISGKYDYRGDRSVSDPTFYYVYQDCTLFLTPLHLSQIFK